MDFPRLQPLPFQSRLLAHLRANERDVWEWFASGRVRGEHVQAARLSLLRSAYRIDRETQPALYELAERAAAGLELDQPITLYQAQQAHDGLNAGIVWIPDEAHIVLHGPVADRLTGPELLSIFGHELAHAVLWTTDRGKYHVMGRILNSLAADPQAGPAHGRTLQLYNLYTEIYCDRGAVIASGDLEVAVSALVKVNAGVSEADARSFLAQAEEVLAADPAPSEADGHPESVIRARCLQLWCEQGDEAEPAVTDLIEGRLSLSRLHLLQQIELAELTRNLVLHLLAPRWMRSEANLAHARMFFEDGRLPAIDASIRPFTVTAADFDPQLGDFLCYVLLDFVTVDADLREQALAHALLVARELRLEERYVDTARTELNLRKRQIDALRKSAAKIVAQAQTVERAG